eukprot:tig00000391_g24868.t1
MRLPPGSGRAKTAAKPAQQAAQQRRQEADEFEDDGEDTGAPAGATRPEPGFVGVTSASPGRFQSKIVWREKNWICSRRDKREDAARDRDRFLIAALGPEAASARGLNYPLSSYESEAWFGLLFRPSGDPPEIGVHDRDTDADAALKRLKQFISSHSGDGRRPQSGFFGVFNVNGSAVTRYRWKNKMFQATWDSAEEGGRSHDRFLLICHGPGGVPERSFNFPSKGYEGEKFYRDMFASGSPPKVGVHDPDPDDAAAAIERAKRYLLDVVHGRGAPQADGSPAPKRKRGRPRKTAEGAAAAAAPAASSAPPLAPPGQRGAGPGITYVPVGEAATGGPAVRDRPVPDVFGVYPVENAPVRFVARVTWRGFLIEYWSDDKAPEAAARVRDRLLVVLFGPQEAEHVGLNYPLSDYKEESFYKASSRARTGPRSAPRTPSPWPSRWWRASRASWSSTRRPRGPRPARLRRRLLLRGSAPAAKPKAAPALPPWQPKASDPDSRRVHVRHPSKLRGGVVLVKRDMPFEEVLKAAAKALRIPAVVGFVDHHNPSKKCLAVAEMLDAKRAVVYQAVQGPHPGKGSGSAPKASASKSKSGPTAGA